MTVWDLLKASSDEDMALVFTTICSDMIKVITGIEPDQEAKDDTKRSFLVFLRKDTSEL